MNPLDIDGFRYVGKAIALAGDNQTARDAMTEYGKAKYKRYHGSEDGWKELLAAAAVEPAVPAGFALARAPTPAELAVAAARQNDPDQLSLSDRELILSYRDSSAENKAAADKVWASLLAQQSKGVLRFESVKVISVTNRSLDVAVTQDNIKTGTADLRVELAKPMPNMPVAGAMIAIEGVIVGYTARPFMFLMENRQN